MKIIIFCLQKMTPHRQRLPPMGEEERILRSHPAKGKNSGIDSIKQKNRLFVGFLPGNEGKIPCFCP